MVLRGKEGAEVNEVRESGIEREAGEDMATGGYVYGVKWRSSGREFPVHSSSRLCPRPCPSQNTDTRLASPVVPSECRRNKRLEWTSRDFCRLRRGGGGGGLE